MIACAPGIIPYLLTKNYNWRKCLQLAVIFNIPRIVLLSVLGIIVGIMGFFLKELITSYLGQIFIPVQFIGYGLLGFFIFFFGAYMFTTGIDKREDLKEQKGIRQIKKNSAETVDQSINKNQVSLNNNLQNSTNICKQEESKLLPYIREKFVKIQNKPTHLFLIWGGILSIACLGEIIVIELSIISGSFGLISNNIFDAGLLGGTAMFLFAIGASLPIIIVATISVPIKTRFIDTIDKLETIRTVFGIVMIIVGLWFIVMLFSFLAQSIF
jgi:cytochrome c biogenesis protein CcdA